ncbi:dual specificity mitogen-activated protein kinase kinase 3 [Protobothrops mucrosquamatus]|uniref:dual specificity mitogen-activated protein kinase kinase 3 n=1 Tax=Protobothrops mucrosquamatus TaxID=103944 RepID=UPI000775D7B9|nr:dual specificity mitogen-activated protein kinase kinase 3 [Protobothrops mucrosquamatus]
MQRASQSVGTDPGAKDSLAEVPNWRTLVKSRFPLPIALVGCAHLSPGAPGHASRLRSGALGYLRPSHLPAGSDLSHDATMSLPKDPKGSLEKRKVGTKKKRPPILRMPSVNKQSPVPATPPRNLDSRTFITIGEKNFEVEADDLVSISELGRGAYGVVEKVHHAKSDTIMAVKDHPFFTLHDTSDPTVTEMASFVTEILGEDS